MVQTDVTGRTSQVATVTNSSNRQISQQKSPIATLASQNLNNSTGIPKPTAAVKGTTKSIADKKSPSSPNVNTTSAFKEYENKMVKPNSALRKPPIGCEAPPPKTEERTFNDSLPRQRNLARREEGNNPSVAMVSPMPQLNGSSKSQVSGSESGSALSEASHTSGHSNSSGNSSVIYKPTSSEDDASKGQRLNVRNR